MIEKPVRVLAARPLVAHDGGEFCWYGHVFHQVCFAAVQDGLDDGLVGEVFVACLGAFVEDGFVDGGFVVSPYLCSFHDI